MFRVSQKAEALLLKIIEEGLCDIDGISDGKPHKRWSKLQDKLFGPSFDWNDNAGEIVEWLSNYKDMTIISLGEQYHIYYCTERVLLKRMKVLRDKLQKLKAKA